MSSPLPSPGRTKTVVVIGGGVCGVAVCHALETMDGFRVILIDKKDYFEFTPYILRHLSAPLLSTSVKLCCQLTCAIAALWLRVPQPGPQQLHTKTCTHHSMRSCPTPSLCLAR